MPFDGNGIFLRVHNWVNDAAASIRIRADRHDQEDNNLASGLTNCITRDGQSSISANLPMSTYKHLNVGEATARNQYARADQVQDGKLNWAVAGGTADDLTLTYPFTFTLSDGQIVNFRASANNTGPVTIDVNSIGANPAVSGGGNAFVGGELVSGGEYSFRYNLANTRFELVGAPKPEAPTAATVSVADTDFEVFTGMDVQAVLEEADALFNGLGTASVEDVGTAIGDVVQLEDVGGNAALPSVDGSQITGFNKIVGMTYAENRTLVSLPTTSSIPLDNTVPDITEGVEVLSASHTAKSVSNKLKIDVIIPTGCAGAANYAVALFAGSTCIAAVQDATRTTTTASVTPVTVVITPPSTSAVTYSVRVGYSSANGALNSGIPGVASLVFGGASVATKVITEISQ